MHGGHAHQHGNDHLHAHAHGGLDRALALTAAFAVIELVGGWLADSLALMADAAHMVSDVAALALASVAGRIAARPAHDGMSYGYGRARVLAAQANGFGLWFVAGWIAWEAVGRLIAPPAVHGSLMLAVAAAGLAANLAVLRWLHGGNDLNTRAAWWHVLGDALGSLAAIAAALLVLWKGWARADAVLSLVVTVILAWGGWRLVRETTLQLMEAAPAGADMAAIRRVLTSDEEALDAHHVHVWTLPDGRLALSAHVCVRDMARWPELLPRLLAALRRAGVAHATLQPETGETCVDDD